MNSRPAWQATPTQELLLRAAMGDGPAAVTAWEQWLATTQWETLDFGSNRMLPLLYRNLMRLKVEHPELARLKRVYLHHWAKNQTALRELGGLVAQLEAAGIGTLVLKGAAMAARYYQDLGVRPMGDFDILVPYGAVDAALEVLQADGWEADSRTYAQLAMPYRESLHARNFYHPARQLSFDLHWHLLKTHLGADDDLPYWEAAEPLQLDEVSTRTLCAADHLIHLCIHATIFDGDSQVRWLPDALVLLRGTPDLDWARVVAQAERLEAAAVVGPKLAYLREGWEVPVPVDVIERLAARPVSYRTRRLYDALATNPWKQSWGQIFWLLSSQYLTTRPRQGRRIPHLIGFLRYLQHRWLVDSPMDMVRGGWARILTRRTRQNQRPPSGPRLPNL